MSVTVLLTSGACHMQDLLLPAGIPGLFPNVLLMVKGNLLEAGALGPVLQAHTF